MPFDISDIKEAYIKFKTHVYYDSTDLILRRKLVEFETNLTKEGLLSKNTFITLDEKLALLTKSINAYHENAHFMGYLLSQIEVDVYPKKLKDDLNELNFISNKHVKDKYGVSRLTAFINAPIELHILSVLWTIHIGTHIDRSLNENCVGNRLLLNKTGDNIVKGSGLFKPYYKQYQKWRDDSVKAAQNILDNNNNALFLNIDIKDYYHSVRIDVDELYNPSTPKYAALQHLDNLKAIFLKIHIKYTQLIGESYSIPYNFWEGLKKDSKGNLRQVILPIGLLSSYVLANSYLKDFDERMIQKIKPAYYGRYVDDILVVISNPKFDYHSKEPLDDMKFSFDDYVANVNDVSKSSDKVSFCENDMTLLEKYVLQNFYPIIKLVDMPHLWADAESNSKNKIFKLNGYPLLFCQSEKSLVYYFDHTESDLVIDKLKKEIEERTSEFRDFPDENKNEESFEDNAYHLLYDGTEGKIQTLKDYKENRFGLTVYLANKIFGALRHDKKISKEEMEEVLKFFRGSTCLTYYRLWERIFTFFLVNEDADSYVKFYFHCLGEIEKLKNEATGTNVNDRDVQKTLLEYLDCSHEITLSLNPKFIIKARKAARHFEFQTNKIKGDIFYSWLNFEPTTNDSFWGKRFLQTNMIRHHYVIHPLLNYTRESKRGRINLTALDVDLKKYRLDKDLIASSPRPVKFWECCLSTIFQELAKYNKETIAPESGYINVNVLGLIKREISKEKAIASDEHDKVIDDFYLDEAYKLFSELNESHIPSYNLNDADFKDLFFKRDVDSVTYDHVKQTKVQEISVNCNCNLNNPVISFANTAVLEANIVASLRNTPNLSVERYNKLANILKKTRLEKSNLLLFPEFFIPINLLSSIVRHSEKNQILTITGLEHIVINKTAFNFIVTILPVEFDGIKDAVVVVRLKNHYAHIEEALIDGNYLSTPKPTPYRYDVFVWKNIYFSTYYCFELANALHRSLMKSKIDLLISVEWNKDTPYFSNIVESGSRDLHCYVAQVNTSQFGDTRLTQPVESARKDILRLKGGTNDAILTTTIDIGHLREFQRQKFSITYSKGEFKPLPPDFSLSDVLKRINNDSIL